MQLYEYQEEYLSRLPKNCIMGADTGTGKTIMALAHYRNNCPVVTETLKDVGNWRNKYDYNEVRLAMPLLILAPASKVRTGDWEREAKEFGLPSDRLTVMSYEKATRKTRFDKWAKGAKATWWEQWLVDNPKYVLIADEVHKAKNPQSLTGKGVFALATNAQQFIGLSATPLPNGWVDICNYGKIFGWWKNKTEFFKDYVITYQIPNQHWSKISGYRQEDKLKELWASVAKPLRKEQALDLPRFKYQVVNTPKPREYDQVRKTRIYRAEELDNAPLLANALRRTIIADRIKWIADFLDGASGHTVIFYNYIEEREAILNIVPDGITVYRQDGEKHELPTKDQWKDLPERSIVLAHYRSGGTGVEMTFADKIIYSSPTYSYADFSQSIGRVYRNGQTLPVTAYLLHTKDTIDSDIWSCIRRKKAFDVELWVKNKEDL
jgi:superfamily II DNA or RNA helicase